MNEKDVYFDYKNNVLKNKLGVKNQKELAELEYKITTLRLIELNKKNEFPRQISMSHLKDIHYYLFNDIYDWAGEYRVVEISKDGKGFMPSGYFEQGVSFLDEAIEGYLRKSSVSKNVLCVDLSKIMIDINHFHPFREGNGRTQREFVRQLAFLKGFELSISSDNIMYMNACVEDDYNLMFDALHIEVEELSKHQKQSDLEL